MAEFEGWTPYKTKGPFFQLASKSYQNHNPGNLKASPFALGTKGGFAYFLDDNTGFFALIWDIWKKCRGETQTNLNGESTIENLIKIYSGEENQIVEHYIKYVSDKTFLSRKTKLKTIIKNDG